MATSVAALIEGVIEGITRRRGSGAAHPGGEVAAAAVAQAREWGVARALIAGDPVLEELGLPAALEGAGVEVLAWPDGRGKGWRDLLGLDGPFRTMGVTVPALAVAERGTLVLEAAPLHGRSIDAVSMFHLPVLLASRIRWSLAEALAETYAAGRRPPSAVSLVSGPSRTSDIEKISTLGAHGAVGIHVLVAEDR
ncbi:LUD domain-containing protein [Miltoncostaea marina]|uniref:LUD domain-containing protein n=1 Tax=Miltoncostaea marina TaxID=2843215 RepID=UPI001C3DFDB7|nr:LUD domain-containing protein [Miltoncostaea marina]